MKPVAIVSAANAVYFPLLEGLLDSVAANAAREDTALCVFDLGLTTAQREQLSARGVRLVEPGWDLSWPALADTPPNYKKYVTVAPFVPRHFPGHEIYVWLDADAWCQTARALDLLIRGARKGRLAVVPVLDRAYGVALSGATVRLFPDLPFLKGRRRRLKTWLFSMMRKYYDRGTANRLLFKPVLSAGIWALPAEAPHWAAWEASLRAARFRSGRDLSDQSPLNHAVYTNDLPVELLPAWCNWTCHMALPHWDGERGLFVEPYLPHEPISIIHMVGRTQEGEHDVPVLGGGSRRMALTYQGRAGSAFPRGRGAPAS
ncbi:MAG: hypothetical protein HXY25_08625 [Alphaproteobacteria bacterium]|nr:hypothetical protein [Alphaproteobacteria bacterium]